MGALIPLALTLAPEIGRYLWGAGGEHTLAAVAGAVRSLTGTDDPAQAQAALSANPEVAANLRIRLAEIAASAEQAARAAELEALRASLADIAGARSQTVELARAGSAVQWAPAAVSLVVLITFGLVMGAALTAALPPGSETILNMLLGTLAAMATSVVGYWVGSSAGSAQKTELLSRAAQPRGE